MVRKVRYYSNPYQNELLKANAIERTQRERDEIDDAIAGTWIGILCFFFIIGVIYLLFK